MKIGTSARWICGGLAFYGAALFILARISESSLGNALALLVIFGIGFPLLAWLGTRWAKPLMVDAHPTGAEMLVLGAYVVLLTLYLAFGPSAIDALLPRAWIESPQVHEIIKLLRKLIFFVALPLALFCFVFGYRPTDFGLQKAAWRELVRSHALVVILVGGSALAFNLFAGNGAAPIREGNLTSSQLAIGLPLCFLWLVLEVGLVEEFFFRVLLQSRLSAWFRSEIAGIILMSFLFGLAHAPGIIFRQAGVLDGLGPNPSPLAAIAFCITTLSLFGLSFGIIWARTKNLLALILVHAATDLMPNLAEFVRVWNIR